MPPTRGRRDCGDVGRRGRAARAHEAVQVRHRGRRAGPARPVRRPGRAARPQRRGQDHDAADAPRRDPSRRGLGDPRRPRAAAPSLEGARGGRLRRRLPAAAREPDGVRVARDLRRVLRHPPPRRRRARRGRALRPRSPRRPAGPGAVLGAADAGRHREGGAPPAPTARARRADGVPRPRRRAARPRCPARRAPRGRHGAAGDQPQHARGRDPLRARRHPRRWPDRGRRLAGGDRPAVRDGGPGGRVPRGRRADRVRGRAAGRRGCREPRTASPSSCAATGSCCGAHPTVGSRSASGR